MSYGPSSTAMSRNTVPGNPPIPADQSPSIIRDGVERTEDLVASLHDQITATEARLESVLSPIGPAAGAPIEKSPQLTSHVHGRLRSLTESLSHAIDRLRDLTQRIEV